MMQALYNFLALIPQVKGDIADDVNFRRRRFVRKVVASVEREMSLYLSRETQTKRYKARVRIDMDCISGSLIVISLRLPVTKLCGIGSFAYEDYIGNLRVRMKCVPSFVDGVWVQPVCNDTVDDHSTEYGQWASATRKWASATRKCACEVVAKYLTETGVSTTDYALGDASKAFAHASIKFPRGYYVSGMGLTV